MNTKANKKNDESKLAILLKPFLKTTLPMILTAVIGALCSSLGNFDRTQPGFVLKMIFLSAFSIFFIALACFYGRNNNDIYARELENIKKERDLYKSKVGVHQECLAEAKEMWKGSAEQINNLYHMLKDEKKINANVWSFQDVSIQVCRIIYKALKDFHNDRNFEITFTLCTKEEGITEPNGNYLAENRSIKMLGYANTNSAKPENFGKNMLITCDNKNIAKKSDERVDEYLFRIGQSEPYIIDDVKEMEKILGTKKRTQYLGIPIFCEDKKMVGLLQITSMKKAKIGSDRNWISDLADDYLIPITKFLLLMHKVEKGLYYLSEGGNEDVHQNC